MSADSKDLSVCITRSSTGEIIDHRKNLWTANLISYKQPSRVQNTQLPPKKK